jgi:hypothetical protein
MLEGEYRADRQPLVLPDAVECHGADLTATIGTDVRLSDLNDRHLVTLSPGHLVIPLWLPIDGNGWADATVGQLLETNSTGPLRIGFGGWRDLLLGCQFRNGNGELITAGGRTVKNVAGYDLTKFMVGQHGIFGKVVTITTRLHRRPDEACRAEFAADLPMLNRLLASPCRPAWALLNPAGLFCGYFGDRRTIDFYLDQLPDWKPKRLERTTFADDQQWRSKHWRVSSSLSPSNPGEGRGEGLQKATSFEMPSPQPSPGVPGEGVSIMRASILPARIIEFAQSANLSDWVADPVFGIVLSAVKQPAKAQDAAARLGGRAWFSTNGSQLLFEPSPEERVILERLKQATDASRNLAPLSW